jgi:hypothetical protein
MVTIRSQEKSPENIIGCAGRFLDSFLLQMVAYRLFFKLPTIGFIEGGSINVEAVSLGSRPNACAPGSSSGDGPAHDSSSRAGIRPDLC